jgi:hypothetical protein
LSWGLSPTAARRYHFGPIEVIGRFSAHRRCISRGAVITLPAFTGLLRRECFGDIVVIGSTKTAAVFFVILVHDLTGLVGRCIQQFFPGRPVEPG